MPAPQPVLPLLTQVVPTGAARPLVLVVGGQADHLAAAALLRALAARDDLPVALLVRAYANNAFDRNREMFAGLDVAGRVIALGIAGGTYAGRAAELMQRFEFVVDQCQPAAAVVFDGSDAALACGLVASRKGVPVVQVGAGLRAGAAAGAADITRKLTDQLSDVLYTSEADASARLRQEGLPAERLCVAGNLTVDALQVALRSSLGHATPRERLGIAPEFLSDRNGYGVVVLDAAANVGDRPTFTELVTIARDVSRDVPLVWPMHTRTREQLTKFRLDVLIRGVAQALSEKWGKPVVVDNRPGASSLIAAEAVAKAPPDGYTLLAVTDQIYLANRFVFKALPYDPDKSFASVIQLARTGQFMIAHPSLAASNAKRSASLTRTVAVSGR